MDLLSGCCFFQRRRIQKSATNASNVSLPINVPVDVVMYSKSFIKDSNSLINNSFEELYKTPDKKSTIIKENIILEISRYATPISYPNRLRDLYNRDERAHKIIWSPNVDSHSVKKNYSDVLIDKLNVLEQCLPFIVNNMSSSTLVACSEVCRSWRDFFHSPSVWKTRIETSGWISFVPNINEKSGDVLRTKYFELEKRCDHPEKFILRILSSLPPESLNALPRHGVRICIVGGFGSGKTALVQKICTGISIEKNPVHPTICSEYHTTAVCIRGKDIKASIHDVSGEEPSNGTNGIAHVYITKSDICIVAFDALSFNSLQVAMAWCDELQRESRYSSVQIIMIATKIDLIEQCIENNGNSSIIYRTLNEGRIFARSRALLMIECSAKSGVHANFILSACVALWWRVNLKRITNTNDNENILMYGPIKHCLNDQRGQSEKCHSCNSKVFTTRIQESFCRSCGKMFCLACLEHSLPIKKAHSIDNLPVMEPACKQCFYMWLSAGVERSAREIETPIHL